MVVYIKNFVNDKRIIPIGREIRVLIMGKFLPIRAANKPYLLNQESDFCKSSSFIKKYFPYFFTNGCPPKYPIKYITMAQKTLPKSPVIKAPKKLKTF